MFSDLLAVIQNLSTPEKQELYHFIEDSLTKIFVGKTDEIKQEIIEARFSEKIICLHCQSEMIVKKKGITTVNNVIYAGLVANIMEI